MAAASGEGDAPAGAAPWLADVLAEGRPGADRLADGWLRLAWPVTPPGAATPQGVLVALVDPALLEPPVAIATGYGEVRFTITAGPPAAGAASMALPLPEPLAHLALRLDAARSPDTLRALKAQSNRNTVLTAAALLAMAAMAAAVLGQHLVRPLRQLTRLVEAMTLEQPLPGPVESAAGDEVGQLTAALNRLQERLRASLRDVERAAEDRAAQAGDSERRLSRLLSVLPDAVWWRDLAPGPDGSRECGINDAAQAILGITPAAFAADPDLLFKLAHPGDRPALEQAWRDCMNGGTNGYASYRVVRPDGQVRWLRHSWRPVAGASGRPVRVEGVMVDVTGRLLAEQRLDEALGELERARGLRNAG